MNIFIFRRDLRIYDNTGLNYLLDKKEKILPIFIFDPKQINESENPYFSHHNVQFLDHSLDDLKNQIFSYSKSDLNLFYGDPARVLENIFKNNKINELVVNEDYTPFSVKRDNNISKLCKKYKVTFKFVEDIPLGNFKKIKTGGGTAYKRFKHFYKKTIKSELSQPIIKKITKNKFKNINSEYSVKLDWLKKKYKYNPKLIVKGGRNNGIIQLNTSLEKVNNYPKYRAFPLVKNKHPTTLLSAYIKYGCVSIREVYQTLLTMVNKDHELIRQLIWRDFYYNLIYFYPKSFTHQTPSYVNNFPWENDINTFEKWCSGKTGFPFVDAGMRQLNTTGYMPNRLRLCCACFLIKNLHINWKWGEKYFAQKLIDYDPAQNNGNWQWVSSTGYETQAYYRYMNPIKDLKTYDPSCIYVKKYIPELSNINTNDILDSYDNNLNNVPYPKPICDFKSSIKKYKDLVKKLK